MTLAGDTLRVAMSDLYYLRRNLPILLATSMVTPLLYLVAFGYGVGSQNVTMEGYDYVAYMIPGVVALTTLTSSFSSISNKLMIQKRFYESFDEMMLCPVSKSSIILGKSVLGVIKGTVCACLLLAIGMLFTDDMDVSPQLVLLIVLSTFAFSLLGVAAGMIVKDLPRMNLFNSFVILPMTFLCGTLFSTSVLPGPFQAAIGVLPLTQSSECIRALALGQAFPWASLLILAAYGAAFYLLARWALRGSNRLSGVIQVGFGGVSPDGAENPETRGVET